MLYLSLFCTLFAFFVQMWAVRATSPSRVSLLLGTEPLWAAIFGITVAGNRMGPLALLGGALVLVATEWGRRTAPTPGPTGYEDGTGTVADAGTGEQTREPAPA